MQKECKVHLSPDKPCFLSEVGCVLKPSGTFAASEPDEQFQVEEQRRGDTCRAGEKRCTELLILDIVEDRDSAVSLS